MERISYPTIDGMDGCGYAPTPEVRFDWSSTALEGVTLDGATDLVRSIGYDGATGMMTSWQTAAGVQDPNLVFSSFVTHDF